MKKICSTLELTAPLSPETKPHNQSHPKSTLYAAALLSGMLACVPAANANLISNGSFEQTTPALSTNQICSHRSGPYEACSATGWTGAYQVGNGTTIGIFGSSFNIPQPDPDGNNALILQQVSSATQSIDVTRSGDYTLTFYDANRTTSGLSGPQTIDVLFDGTSLSGATFSNIPGSWTLETIPFYANAGMDSLTFEGLGNGNADVSAFVDDVSLNPTPSTVPEPIPLSMVGLALVTLPAVMRRATRVPHQALTGVD